jgi:hypothetical protein
VFQRRRVPVNARSTYEIRIAGRLDEAAAESFEGLDVAFHAGVTVVTGQFDQAALHGMLEMIRSLGLDLLEARRVPVTRRVYEIRVAGSPGPATQEAFADLAVEVEPDSTVLSGELDQRGLHALLDRVRALGLELVGIRQAPPAS